MKASIGVVIAMLVFGSAVAAEPAGPLDGKVFTGELGKAGASTGDPDTLTFQKGSFISSACVPFGFKTTPYLAAAASETTSFSATATNAKGETMEWTGTMRGDAIEAKAVYRTSTGETETYWFKGKAGAAKAPQAPKKSEHPEHPKK